MKTPERALLLTANQGQELLFQITNTQTTGEEQGKVFTVGRE